MFNQDQNVINDLILSNLNQHLTLVDSSSAANSIEPLCIEHKELVAGGNEELSHREINVWEAIDTGVNTVSRILDMPIIKKPNPNYAEGFVGQRVIFLLTEELAHVTGVVYGTGLTHAIGIAHGQARVTGVTHATGIAHADWERDSLLSIPLQALSVKTGWSESITDKTQRYFGEIDEILGLLGEFISTSIIEDRVKIAQRANSLNEARKREDAEPMSSGSLKYFIKFINSETNIKKPSIVLSLNGNLTARWIADNDRRIIIQFTPEGIARYTVFMLNTKHENLIDSTSGVTSVDSVYEFINSKLGVTHWNKE